VELSQLFDQSVSPYWKVTGTYEKKQYIYLSVQYNFCGLSASSNGIKCIFKMDINLSLIMEVNGIIVKGADQEQKCTKI
jgi:hypothetical protein